jgi:hypothetical protein
MSFKQGHNIVGETTSMFQGKIWCNQLHTKWNGSNSKQFGTCDDHGLHPNYK